MAIRVAEWLREIPGQVPAPSAREEVGEAVRLDQLSPAASSVEAKAVTAVKAAMVDTVAVMMVAQGRPSATSR